MRNKQEIEKAADALSNRPEYLDWKGDTFRYGFLIGKLVALGWVLGEPSSDMVDYEFDDWIQELRASGGIPPYKGE